MLWFYFTLNYWLSVEKKQSDECKELSFLPSAENVAKISNISNPSSDMAPKAFPQQDSTKKSGVPCKDSSIL